MSLVEQARKWPRDGFGEGRLFNELADEIERLQSLLGAETCTWPNGRCCLLRDASSASPDREEAK